MFGVETEFFIIDDKGDVVNKADEVLDLSSKMTRSSIVKECGHSMIEQTSFPHTSTRASFGHIFEDMEDLLVKLEAKELGLFYYGTYPGVNKGEIRSERRYIAKKKILGEKQFSISTKCIGFHFHFSLPRKSFNENIKYFFPDINYSAKKKVLNLFNLYTAIDPAITTLMQSSPYFEGRLEGKDSRIMHYRGDEIFKTHPMLYENYPEFGTLNEYSVDFEQMISRIRDRTTKWRRAINRYGFDFHEFSKSDSIPSILDSSWKPVKISPHGTIEQRGCDMNKMSLVAGASLILKYLSTNLQNTRIEITPSEIGTNEPFKLEDDTLHIPMHGHLRNLLQHDGAIRGLESPESSRYCERFLGLARKFLPDDQRKLILPFEKMLDEGMTESDKIISFVKKRQGDCETISKETAREFALHSIDHFYRDLTNIRKISESHEFELGDIFKL